MRHRVAGKRLKRSAGHRKALRRNLVTALFYHERIETTEAKAKVARGQAEKLITLAKRAIQDEDNPGRGVQARRLASGRLNRWVTDSDGAVADVLEKLFEDIAPRYMDRPGGYTRMYKLGPRKGDAASMVLLELVEE